MKIRRWSDLSPKTKRLAVVLGALGAVSFLVMMLPSGKSDRSGPKSNEDVIRHVLTDRDTRTVGLESLAASIKLLEGRSTAQTRQLEKMERDLDLAKKQQTTVPPSLNSQIERMTAQIDHLEGELKKAKESKPSSNTGDGSRAGDHEGASTRDSAGPTATREADHYKPGSYWGLQDLTKQNPMDVFLGSNIPPTLPGGGNTERDKERRGAPKIKVVMEDVPVAKPQEGKDLDESFYLPAGSIVTGTLLNGMDAPTGQGARQDPFPVTMRIQKEAILPNRFRADIRECFVVVSGYGDLSSERANLRGETISCVREDGAVLESAFNAYAVGEDGKAGVRGRLVSKQGQVIARSLMAGFLSGLSKAFDVKPVPIIDTSNRTGNSNTQFQRNEPNGDWLQSSAVSGASNALEKVADFYLKMAEGMFPVIEVDAGRQIDLIVSKGTKLQFRSTGIQK